MDKIAPAKDSKVIEIIIDFLIDIPLFDELKANDLRIVARQMNSLSIKRHDIVFKEGEKGNYICFVVDGIIDIIKQSSKKKFVVIASLPRGRSIGEMSVIDDYPRSATARARTQSTLLILSRQGLDAILKENPQTGIKILKGLARLLSMNLRKTSSQLADFMLTHE